MTNWDEHDPLPYPDLVSGPLTIVPLGPSGVVHTSSYHYGTNLVIDTLRVFLDKRNWRCFVGEDSTYTRHVHLRVLYSYRSKSRDTQHKIDMCLDPDTAAELARALWSYSSKVVTERVIKEFDHVEPAEEV